MKRALLALVLGTTACASSLQNARHMGVTREGRLNTAEAQLLRVVVTRHPEAPLTLPNGPVLTVPQMPVFESLALESAVIDAVEDVGIELGVAIDTGAVDTSDSPIFHRFRALLDDDIPAGVALTVHIGWCSADQEWVACVRSPDSALGYGPPGIEGFVYSRFKSKGDHAIARRVAHVHKAFVYEVDDSGAHGDRPFVGTGTSFDAQATDAIRQAVDAWFTVARGRAGQRLRDAATAD